MVLQSFDTNSNSDRAEATLKTDIVTIYVTDSDFTPAVVTFTEPSVLATFTEVLTVQVIFSGETTDWTLPPIDQGIIGTLQDVIVTPDPLIARYVTFEETTSTLAYSGTAIAGLNTRRVVFIDINLVNDIGPNTYSQRVIIYPSREEPLGEPLSVAEGVPSSKNEEASGDQLAQSPEEDLTSQEQG